MVDIRSTADKNLTVALFVIYADFKPFEKLINN